eukprot:scaffold127222_cov32-Tisochrysis_lutea.AAC.10
MGEGGHPGRQGLSGRECRVNRRRSAGAHVRAEGVGGAGGKREGGREAGTADRGRWWRTSTKSRQRQFKTENLKIESGLFISSSSFIYFYVRESHG